MRAPEARSMLALMTVFLSSVCGMLGVRTGLPLSVCGMLGVRTGLPLSVCGYGVWQANKASISHTLAAQPVKTGLLPHT